MRGQMTRNDEGKKARVIASLGPLTSLGAGAMPTYTIEVDPSGYAPTVLGHEGAGVVERCGVLSLRLHPGIAAQVGREHRGALGDTRRTPRKYEEANSSVTDKMFQHVQFSF